MSRFDPRSFQPREKRYKVSDPSTPGLLLFIQPSGEKIWYWERHTKQFGRLSIRLGSLREVGRADASEIATGHNLSVAKGVDPRYRTDTLTLDSLWSEFFRRYSRPNKRSWKDDLRIWNTHLSQWRMRPVSSITRADVTRLRDSIGTARANRVLALLSKMFEWGVEVEMFDLPNPCSKVKKVRERSRERFLTVDEMKRLSSALNNQPQWFSDYVRVSLLTGQRQSNVLAMHRDQIDFDASVWRIPRQKNGSSHLVPLVPEALEIIQRRVEESEWVFPVSPERGRRSDTTTPHATSSTVKRRWKKVCEQADIADVWMHDLRRTNGALQAISGVNTTTIGASLGHKSVQATAIYARVNTGATRLALTTAASIITSSMSQEPGGSHDAR